MEAIRAYNEILSQNPKDARAWFGKGRALHRSFAHGSLSMAAFAWG